MTDENKSSEQDDYLKVFCRKCETFVGKIKREDDKDAHFYCSNCKTMNNVVIQIIKISVNARPMGH